MTPVAECLLPLPATKEWGEGRGEGPRFLAVRPRQWEPAPPKSGFFGRSRFLFDERPPLFNLELAGKINVVIGLLFDGERQRDLAGTVESNPGKTAASSGADCQPEGEPDKFMAGLRWWTLWTFKKERLRLRRWRDGFRFWRGCVCRFLGSGRRFAASWCTRRAQCDQSFSAFRGHRRRRGFCFDGVNWGTRRWRGFGNLVDNRLFR